MVQRLVILAGAMLLLGSASSSAQDGIAGQLYGAGVHAFFEGDYQQAHKLLTESLDTGSRDPRTYYFRGLTYAKLGRDQEAEMDFAKGSELESSDVDRLYNISKAIERIQGADRLKIEKYRTKARVAAYQKAEQLRKARYEQMRREEDRVLEQQSRAAPVPAGQSVPTVPNVSFGEAPANKPEAKPALPPEPNTPPVPAKEPATTPPAEKMGESGNKAAGPAAVPEAAPGADPFAASPVEEKKTVTAKSATGATEKKAGTKKKAVAADDTDPFAAPPADEKKAGTKKKAAAADDTDPFAAPPADEKKAGAKKKAAAADDTDPFAAPPAEVKKGASGKAADAKKAGAKAKAKKAADDSDPFASDSADQK